MPIGELIWQMDTTDEDDFSITKNVLVGDR